MARDIAFLLMLLPALATCFQAAPRAIFRAPVVRCSAEKNPGAVEPELSRRTLIQSGFAVAAGSVVGRSAPSAAEAVQAVAPAPVEFDKLDGDLSCAKILTGMWQLSGSHGYRPDKGKAVEAMKKQVEAGFTTFDLADHYGQAEPITALFRKEHPELWAKSQFFTKWVPMPGSMDRKVVEGAINTRLSRMGTDSLDLLQFHWWDYSSKDRYLEALGHMQDLVTEGKIKKLALTNFDTENLAAIRDAGIKVVSNQVQYSLIDQRPARLMAPYCQKQGMKLLAYGTVCGGFLTDKYVGRARLTNDDFDTVSKRKYYNMIEAWGGWDMFQELLGVLSAVGAKHRVSVTNVATRWVIDQPGVAGAIVGARLGLTDHVDDNLRTFGFKLDSDDLARIAAVTSKSRDLLAVIGDCGAEYRG